MIAVEWTGIEDVVANLARYEIEQRMRLRLACEEVAQLLERYAIMNHPWNVFTGATNVTTKGTWAEVAGDLYEVVLSAGMWYDVYLELAGPTRGDYARHSASLPHNSLQEFGGGKYAWLWPAISANQREIINTFARHLAHR